MGRPCGLLGMGRFAIGRLAGYWVWDASLLAMGDGRWGIGDGVLAMGDGVLAMGDGTPCGLLGMGRSAMGRPAGYWRWGIGDGVLAMGDWR